MMLKIKLRSSKHRTNKVRWIKEDNGYWYRSDAYRRSWIEQQLNNRTTDAVSFLKQFIR